ncbi:hypothetical protein BH11PLA1_BH11PLA1_01550 [soil metagenome]
MTGAGTPTGIVRYSSESPGGPLAAPAPVTTTATGGDSRMLAAAVLRGDKVGTVNPALSTLTPLYTRSGLLLNDGERFHYVYDLNKQLIRVDRDLAQAYWATPEFPAQAEESPSRYLPFAKFTYDALGRRISAQYDDNHNGDFRDELVEFFIHDSQWRVAATYRQAPAPRFAPENVIGETDPPTYNTLLSEIRPAPLLYERYVYHARGLGGRTDIKGPDTPILRQRFKYFGTRQVTHLDPETGEPDGTEPLEIEVFTPGGDAATGYTRAQQETVYYIQDLHGDVVSLLTEELNDKGYHAGARPVESVRYTSFGVPRVSRRLVSDVGDDAGDPLYQGMTTIPGHGNSGINEGDYTAFFNSFFSASPTVGDPADIADDGGTPLVYGKPVGDSPNSGVNEGDFNCFFNHFFNETSTRPSTEAGGGSDRRLEWGELSFPETNNRIGYAGYWWDEHLNMYCVRNRWYLPRTGRWLTPDPIGYAGGRNLFEYCQSRPFDFYDPNGLWSVMRWLYTGDGNASQEIYNAALDGAASTLPPNVIRAADALDNSTVRRGLGALQTFAGATAVAGGTVMGWTGLGVGVAVVGGDMVQSGARQVISGEWTSSVLSQVFDTALSPVLSDDDRPVVVGAFTSVTQAAAAGIGARPAANGALKLAFDAELVGNATPGFVLRWLAKIADFRIQRPSVPPATAVTVTADTTAGKSASATCAGACDGPAVTQAYGGTGGGHHVLAKSALVGAEGYDLNAALAISNAELKRLGLDHSVITGGQQIGYRALALSGEKLSWEAMERIETQALIRAGMQPGVALATVRKSIQEVKDAGVVEPIRIPWSKK